MNLEVVLARRMRDQPSSSARLLTLESDCVSMGTFGAMGTSNLAIPFDGKFAHVLKVLAVPSKSPVASLASPVVSIFEVRIGYTMP
jgi:hypothetical protein